FNADKNIVGQSVTINGKAATIIGVMAPGLKFPFSEELWTPLYNEWPPTPRGELFLGANSRAPAVMGRLQPGVTLDQANAEMIAIARHLAADNPKTNKDLTSANVQPLLNAFTGVQLRQIVWAMLGAVILVLLIACVNVMNMQFGCAALCRHPADQIDPQPDQARLRLRRERTLCRAACFDGGSVSERRFAPRILHPRCSRSASKSTIRSRGHDRSLSHDLRRVRTV